jgi:cytoskeletal protein RodZ
MESLGEKLRTAREEKDLTIDQASRDTNIAARFLEALEAEKFSGFPGETYITGFLRSYGSYLGLNVQEVLLLYRAFKIQEQPVPVEQLLKTPSKLPKILLISGIALAVLAIAAVITYFIIFPKEPKTDIIVNRPQTGHVLGETALERRLYVGDYVLVNLDVDQYKLELTNLGDAVTIRTPTGPLILDLSQEANVDLNGNGIPDVAVMVIDFVKNNPDMGTLLRIEAAGSVALNDFIKEGEQITSNTVQGSVPSSRTVLSSANPYPFTLQAVFQGYCMFRWEILFERDRQDRNERYFQRSDELNIQAQNGIRIWASNAQAARFQVIGGGQVVPVELGSAGEIVVAEIRWVRDEDGRYRLVIARL